LLTLRDYNNHLDRVRFIKDKIILSLRLFSIALHKLFSNSTGKDSMVIYNLKSIIVLV